MEENCALLGKVVSGPCSDLSSNSKVVCPYCEGTQVIREKPSSIGFLWAHPLEGKRKEDWNKLGRNPYLKIFGPLAADGEVEKSVSCKKCKSEFHVKGFLTEPEGGMEKYFRAEIDGVPPSTIVERIIPSVYPVSCFLLSLALYILWIVPISMVGGFTKAVSDLMGPLLVFITTILLLSIKFHGDRIRSLKDPFCVLLKTRQCFREWTYYRYAYTVLGRPDPPIVSSPSLAGIVSGLSFVVLWVLLSSHESLTLVETTAPNAGFVQHYTSIVSYAAGLTVWSAVAFLFGVAVWIAVSTVWTVNRVGLWLPLNYDPLSKTAGVRSLAELAAAGLLPLASSEIAFLLLLLALIGRSQQLQWTFVGAAIIAGLVIALFVAALSSVRDGVRRWKEEYLSGLSKRYLALTDRSKGLWLLTENERAAESSLLAHYDRVTAIREWPYDLGILSRVLTVAASGAIVAIVQLVLGYVLR
jgi:hypothetical protein